MEPPSETKALANSVDARRSRSRPGVLQLSYIQDQQEAKETSDLVGDDRGQTPVINGEDLALCSPPRTENEVRLISKHT